MCLSPVPFDNTNWNNNWTNYIYLRKMVETSEFQKKYEIIRQYWKRMQAIVGFIKALYSMYVDSQIRNLIAKEIIETSRLLILFVYFYLGRRTKVTKSCISCTFMEVSWLILFGTDAARCILTNGHFVTIDKCLLNHKKIVDKKIGLTEEWAVVIKPLQP